MENGALGVRRWEIYTGQVCTCGEGEGEMYLGVDPLLPGYKTTQDWLDSIAFELARIDNTLPCTASNNCTIQLLPGQYAEVSQDGVCEDAIYVADQLGVAAQTVLEDTFVVDFSGAPAKNYTYWTFGSSPIQL